MKVIYTEAAEQEILNFQQQQKAMLESIVSERKVVFGDEVLEITASDIKEASRKIQIFRPTNIRYSNVQVITKVYVVLGTLMMISAIFYPKISELFYENRTQAMIFLMGGVMTVIGVLANYFYALRRRRYLEVERMMIDSAQRNKE